MSDKPRQALVLDTAAFIAGNDSLYSLTGLRDEYGNPLQPRSASTDTLFYTTPDVIAEVRDPNAKVRLKLLEDLITLRMPSEESLAAVIEFCKATGDYEALSITDLRVVALAYMLEFERNGKKFLKMPSEVTKISKPRGVPAHVLDEIEEAERLEKNAKANMEDDEWTTVVAKQKPLSKHALKRLKNKEKRERKKTAARNARNLSTNRIERPTQSSQGDGEDTDGNVDLTLDANSEMRHAAKFGMDSQASEAKNNEPTGGIATSSQCDPNAPCLHDDASEMDTILSPLNSLQNVSSRCTTGDEEKAAQEIQTPESDGDDDGWITTENLEQHLAEDGGHADKSSYDDIRVGCVTTDYAMQNVLLQMGIKVVSVDGRRVIKQIRRYLLRCHGCGEIERDLERKFCHSCGLPAFHKVAFKIDKKGVARVFVNPKWKPNLRGTVYSIPMPKGGRNNKDLVLRDDQLDRVKQRRLQKQRAKHNVDVLDPGGFYNAGAKFAKIQERTVIGYGRRNPNESRPWKSK